MATNVALLLKQLDRAQAEAKAANLRRYGEIDSGYGQRESDVLGLLENLGQANRSDLISRNTRASARAGQDLISRGLTGTTIKSNVAQGFSRDLGQTLDRHDQGIAAQRAKAMSGLRGDRLRFQERRDDVGPDMNAYNRLLQQLGQSRRSLRGVQRTTITRLGRNADSSARTSVFSSGRGPQRTSRTSMRSMTAAQFLREQHRPLRPSF